MNLIILLLALFVGYVLGTLAARRRTRLAEELSNDMMILNSALKDLAETTKHTYPEVAHAVGRVREMLVADTPLQPESILAELRAKFPRTIAPR